MWELREKSMGLSGTDEQIIDGGRYLAKGVVGTGQSWNCHDSECPPISESE